MQRYDDPVEVRRGAGPGGDEPEQFLWRGRLWKVRAVVARWVETGARWPAAPDEPLAPVEGRELWRVQAGRGGLEDDGVFDLSFDQHVGCWQLVGAQD